MDSHNFEKNIKFEVYKRIQDKYYISIWTDIYQEFKRVEFEYDKSQDKLVNLLTNEEVPLSTRKFIFTSDLLENLINDFDININELKNVYNHIDLGFCDFYYVHKDLSYTFYAVLIGKDKVIDVRDYWRTCTIYEIFKTIEQEFNIKLNNKTTDKEVNKQKINENLLYQKALEKNDLLLICALREYFLWTTCHNLPSDGLRNKYPKMLLENNFKIDVFTDENKQYAVYFENEAQKKVIGISKYTVWHVPYFAMNIDGRKTHSYWIINPSNKNVIDAAPNKSLAIPFIDYCNRYFSKATTLKDYE